MSGVSPLVPPAVPMHPRQTLAWHRAWDAKLFDFVECHGGGLYTVPSQSAAGEFYAVQRWTLRSEVAPDGYLFTCTCPASERGGAVCKHICAVYLWRLVWRLGWRIKDPTGRGR